MTQDDLIKLALIKLAQESGLAKVLDEHASEYRDGWFENSEYPELLAFVKLVAGVEREHSSGDYKPSAEAAAELRRLHEGNKDLLEALKDMGARYGLTDLAREAIANAEGENT
jgi:hypothetical protein